MASTLIRATRKRLFGFCSYVLKSDQTCVTGGWSLGSGGTAAPKKCPALPDPLASLSTPATGGACIATDLTINGGTPTLTPGVYCKKLELNSGAVVTLQAGIYVFREALLKVNSASTLKGNNVLLFFHGEKYPYGSGQHELAGPDRENRGALHGSGDLSE